MSGMNDAELRHYSRLAQAELERIKPVGPRPVQKACPSCQVVRDPEVDHRPAMLEIGSYDHALRSYDEELHVVGYTCRCCGHRWWEPK